MNDDEISQTINNYVRKNLSPKPEQRDYITKKYEELRGFLKNSCFQSGSYARFTAIDPVHDLDIIYVLPDNFVVSHPQQVMNDLRGKLLAAYANSSISKIKEITGQTHSITITFDDGDAPEALKIDVVPAVTVDHETNEFGDPIYLVPEILKANHQKREQRYELESENPIGWIKSDPRGYVSAATNLDNATNGTFRKTVKVVKAWRHQQKMVHKDQLKLKSFHLELVCVEFFGANPTATTLDAVAGSMALLANRLDIPHYADRADRTKYVDEYINGLTDVSRKLILDLRQEAAALITSISQATNVTEVTALLDKLTSTDNTSDRSPTPTFSQRVVVPAPSQPWGY